MYMLFNLKHYLKWSSYEHWALNDIKFLSHVCSIIFNSAYLNNYLPLSDYLNNIDSYVQNIMQFQPNYIVNADASTILK